MTQTQMVLDALRRGPLTPLEALERFGCFRLAARVLELREQGHAIWVERHTLPNGKRVARYRMRAA
jgi:hypothetical protein